MARLTKEEIQGVRIGIVSRITMADFRIVSDLLDTVDALEIEVAIYKDRADKAADQMRSLMETRDESVQAGIDRTRTECAKVLEKLAIQAQSYAKNCAINEVNHKSAGSTLREQYHQGGKEAFKRMYDELLAAREGSIFGKR